MMRMTRINMIMTKMATMWANARLRAPCTLESPATEDVRKASRWKRAEKMLLGVLLNAENLVNVRFRTSH